MRYIVCVTAFLLLSKIAHCQPQLGNFYHRINPDGSVSVLAENRGFVPYTLTLTAELTHMSSTPALPTNIVLFPSKQPRVVAVFTPEPGQAYTFRYHQTNQFGIYPTQLPDTSHAYSLPFALAAGEALPPCGTNNARVLGNKYPYFFTLRPGTAIRAVRTGIVATVRQELSKSHYAKANYIVVFHEDGSYAWYQNLQRGTAAVSIGQRVVEGDVIGYLSAEKSHPPLYFGVMYPGERKPIDLPIVFKSTDNQLLRFRRP